MFEDKRNVHCFFDATTGQWLKLPISWELYSEPIKDLISQVEVLIVYSQHICMIG